MDIIGLLQKHSDKNNAGAVGAFIDYNGTRLGYADILKRSAALAESLESYGLSRGAVCALICFNHINFIYFFTACLKMRAVPVIINAKYGADELRGIINASEVKTIITDNIYAFEGVLTADGSEINIINPEIKKSDNAQPSGAVLQDSTSCDSRFALQDGPAALYSDVLNDGTLFMLITSASGGRPKIVKKSGAALSYQAEKLYPRILSGPQTRYFTNVPPSHSYGLEFAVFGAIYNGVPLFIRDFNFSGDALEEIALNSITHIFSVPPFLLNLVNYKLSSGTVFDSLEAAVSAGMPLLPGLASKFYAAFNFNIASVYGITEAGCVSFKDAGKHLPSEGASINNDVGFPLDGNEIFVPGDDGAPLPASIASVEETLVEGDSDPLRANIGRIIVRKKIPDGGYYKLNDAAAADKWRRGFCELETDDSGYIDSRGALHLLTRSSAFINIGGSKINALDIEAYLRSTQLFKDVIVFGQKDGYMGEKIAAAIVVGDDFKLSGEQVRGLCAEKLPPIKVPRDIYILRQPFPRTAAGKIRFDKVIEIIKSSPAN
jgi:fatty-acyl-CoA synthase